MDVIGRWLPLGFVYLAGSARLAGFDAEIYDARAMDHGYPEIERYFCKSDAAYIASTAITASVYDAIRTLELAKRVNPKVVTILGGVHPSFCYEEVLNATSAIDYIVCGEGEETLGELLLTLEGGGDPGELPGLAFHRNAAIVKTPDRKLSESLDNLHTAWDLVDWQAYHYFVLPGSRLAAISTSRASSHCEISSPLLHSRRYREPCKVLDEIIHLHTEFGVNVFLLTDDLPTCSRKRWELFLDLLIERNLQLYLLMQTTPSDIIRDHDIIWKYRKAGVIHIYIGSEVPVQVAIDPTDKGGETSEFKVALDIIREHGIISEASFVVGGPDETSKNIERTLKLAQYYNPDNAQFIPVTPWPNDQTLDGVREFVRVFDYVKYNLIDPVIEPKHMSLLQVDSAIMHCHRRFYMGKMAEIITMKDTFKRGYLLRAMKLMMVNPFILSKLGMGSLSTVPARIGEIMRKDIF